MIESAVPVSMGSPCFGTWAAQNALITLLTFPGRVVLKPHVHDRPTFAVILSGGFELTFTKTAARVRQLSCPSGTILTQPAGERHSNCIGDAGAFGVVLQPHLGHQSIPRRCAQVLEHIHHFRSTSIAVTARRLAREIAAPDDVTPLAVEGLVLEMLAAAARLDVTSGDKRLPPWLRRATDFVHEHFRDVVHVSDVAAVAGVHAAHLACGFRRYHRVSIGAYVRHLRIQWAAERLVDGETPIAVIAIEAGFSDQAHLTRWFRRVTNWSPAAYRRSRARAR